MSRGEHLLSPHNLEISITYTLLNFHVLRGRKRNAMIAENDFYTSSEARKKLGVSTSTFKNLVDAGEIRKITPPGKKQGVYVKEDVDKVAKRNLQTRRRKSEPILIDWLYAKDVPAGLKLSQMVYPGEVNLAEAAIYQAWRKNNPYLTMAAF